MDQGLILIVLIVLILTILAFTFNWINENYNYYIDEHTESSQKIKELKEKISTEISNWKRENGK